MPVQHTPADALELRQLRQLAAIAESGSINAAAKALAIAQPALSRSLQALEASVGVRLVEQLDLVEYVLQARLGGRHEYRAQPRLGQEDEVERGLGRDRRRDRRPLLDPEAEHEG